MITLERRARVFASKWTKRNLKEDLWIPRNSIKTSQSACLGASRAAGGGDSLVHRDLLTMWGNADTCAELLGLDYDEVMR